jgi:hypothetical protein
LKQNAAEQTARGVPRNFREGSTAFPGRHFPDFPRIDRQLHRPDDEASVAATSGLMTISSRSWSGE